MPDPSTYRPATGTIPAAPGVYKFRDPHGRVIYVGKAKSLRSRLNSYFADVTTLHPRTRQMVTTAGSVEWTVVSTEVEALQLEYNWIKEFDPRFNVRYRDDKTYPVLAVTLNEEFPRLFVYRGPRRKGVRYFGPYSHAWAIRDDIGALRKALEKQAVVLGDGTDADLVAFAADDLEAAVQVFHVRGGRVRGQRGWVVEKAGDAIDWAALDAESDLPILVEQFLTQFYGEQAALDPGAGSEAGISAVPKEVLVPVLPANATEIQAWLSKLRGSQVQLRVPQRGDKKDLAETVQRNAKEALAQHKLKRAGDFTSRSAALQGIQEALDLDSAPLRIECIDISHVQGTDVVASLVVFEDGLPRKSDYRHYAIKEAAGDGHSDDVASIAEITRRRFLRHNRDLGVLAASASTMDADGGDLAPEAAIDPATGRPRRFAYPPNLFVVDGGAPQVTAAAAVLDELGVTDVAVVGLAKRLEEVWVPGEEDPVILPRTSESLYLLQRIRDEAHRFAITFHRSKRSRRMTASALDSVKGLGETRRTALVAHFGSVAKLKTATVEEIMQVPGIGETTATAVLAALGTDSAAADTGAEARALPAPVGDDELDKESESSVTSADAPSAESGSGDEGSESRELSMPTTGPSAQ